jgi:hypothetical protein
MAGVVFPELATIQLMTGERTRSAPLRVAGLVFWVQLRAAFKNDYTLGPFVSDADGHVPISREACQAFVDANHDTGVMDYAGIGQCSTHVEIRHLSEEELRAAAQARRTTWTQLLAGEVRLFLAIADLIHLYDAAPNARFAPAREPLEAMWDGKVLRPRYEYFMHPVAPA